MECLASIEKIDYPNFEVILVDNGSSDDSVSKIRLKYPQHVYIEAGKNLGFSEGNNLGLKEGLKREAELLVLLNNDTIVGASFLKEIASAAEKHPEVGAFGPKIYYFDEPATIWYAGGGVDPKSGRCYHVGCGDPKGHTEECLTDYICGCAFAIRSNVLKEVGFLDPKFFLLWEEVDWCFRIRKAGYFCLFIPKAKVWHKISSSFVSGNRGPMWQYFYYRNRLLFHKKHSSHLWKKNYTSEICSLIQRRFFGKAEERKCAKAALSGIFDFFFRRFGKGRISSFTQK